MLEIHKSKLELLNKLITVLFTGLFASSFSVYRFNNINNNNNIKTKKRNRFLKGLAEKNVGLSTKI